MLYNEGKKVDVFNGDFAGNCTLGDLAVAAIATVLVTSNQTQSLYIQKSRCPSA